MAYCDTVLFSGSATVGAIEMSHLALVDTLVKALQGVCGDHNIQFVLWLSQVDSCPIKLNLLQLLSCYYLYTRI